MADSLSLENLLNSHDCTCVIKSLATSSHELFESKSKLINYLMVKNEMPGSGVVQTLSCNLSGISWKKLIKQNHLDYDAIKVIVAHGGSFKSHDIQIMITVCEDKVPMLELIMNHCTPKPTSTDMCKFSKQALKCKKFGFIKVLISCGAKSTVEGRVELFIKALKCSEYDFAESLMSCTESESIASKISLSSVLECPFQGNLEARKCFIFIVKRLLENGIDPNGNGNANSLDIVLKLSKDHQTEKIELLTLLLQQGAAIERCTYQRKNETTLLHIATKFAIESGTPQAMQLVEEVCKHYPFSEDGRVQDKRGDTPYHIVMERRRSPNTIKICKILSQHDINPSVPNEHGKKPRHTEKNDERCAIMLEAAKKFQTPKKKGKKKKGKPSEALLQLNKEKDKEVADSKHSQALPADSTKKSPEDELLLGTDDALQDVKEILSHFSEKPESYFEPPPTYKRQRSLPHTTQATESGVAAEGKGNTMPDTAGEKCEKATVVHSDQPIREFDIENIASNFEGRTWEVECTEKVKKFFANMKVPRYEKEAVVKTVYKLVDGVPTNNQKLCKEVRTSSKLFEARYSGASRILYELSIQFSPRLTSISGSTSGSKEYIYSEVIRLWDIVRDHDNLNHHIDQIVQCIEKSHARGETAAICTPLKMPQSRQCTQGQAQLRLPQFYVLDECDVKIEDVQTQLLNFFPAGSTKDDEYNVITFYSFDNSFVKSMLDGENSRRDFPFKEWPKEHDIINMPQGKVSILLLGRSGTGKTTCCLYRLWNQFKSYWIGVVNDEPMIPRKPLPILENREESVSEDREDENSSNDSTDSDVSGVKHPSPELPNPNVRAQSEHFHQVFITKNYVLCAQMKKRFYDLAASRDIAKDHMQYEDADVPTSLCDVSDHAYPLFLTARQFFLLLDNSLNDGNNFFNRDERGQLLEKIVSSDYDHEDPDTLLDLEESDSEDEVLGDSDFDEDLEPQTVKEKKKLQRREVTASYFAEKIWPKISKKAHAKMQDARIDPLLVWMEIKSFIKGSREAVLKEEGHLTREEYEDLGKKMAPNYDGKRQDIYEIFELYKKYVHHHIEENVFDESDLNHNIHFRLNGMEDLPWSIHSIYIDEVQDFTQAELSILLRICRNPNDLFLTGDTAQSIMRGIAFRFGDVKSLFFHASKQAPKSKKLEVPRVDELTINFRSHTGVLKLAASVIGLMKAFFPESFDCLPGDEGMFPGPSPIVLDSCNVSDLALVLRTNKRESSTIEFGAHQVIIVQSEKAKKNIPDVLKAGIVLTVFESKGLEFDDVLLYNFFKDSKIEKDWRVVTSFIEDNPDQVIDEAQFTEKPRRLEFDKNLHKSLNAELKYLYTAITRAKCNLWIYDSDKDKRLPVFDYWSKKGLVKVIRVSDISEDDQGSLFSATSTKEEWRAQGDYFKRKKLWEPAMKCFQKAECPHLESEARAYSLAQQARTPGLKPKEKEEIYLKSAHAFLKCDQAQHDYQYLENAAKCLKNAKKYEESSQLYLHLGQINKARKGFRRAKKPESLAMVMDKQGDCDGVIRLLIKHNRIVDALKYAAKYEAEKRSISKVHRVHHLASHHAEKLALKLHNETLLKESEAGSEYLPPTLKEFEVILMYLPPTDRVDFLKSAGMHDKACEVLLQEGKYEEIYRVYTAQGWHEEGIQLAREQKNRNMELAYTLFKASTEIDSGELTAATAEVLKKKWGSKSESEAKAALVYGMGIQNHTIVWQAYHYYKTERIPIGQIEALNIAIERAEFNEQKQEWSHMKRNGEILNLVFLACNQVKLITDALKAKEPNAVQSQIVNQVESFYGLQKGVVDNTNYSIPPYSYPWTNELLRGSDFSDKIINKDADGMHEIEVKSVLREIYSRCQAFVERWIIADKFGLIKIFHRALTKHPFHEQVISGGYLTESLTHTVKALKFQQYFDMLSQAFEIAFYGNTQIMNKAVVIRALLSIISPQATCYLAVTSFKVNSELLIERLQKEASQVLGKTDEQFVFDKWYEAWLISCITKKGGKMEGILQRWSDNHNRQTNKIVDSEGFSLVYKRQRSQDLPHRMPPPVYVLDRTDEYKHVMLLWLKTCELLRDKKILPSCTIAVHEVIRHIASNKSIWTTVSVSNLLHIVKIHTTAILTMYAACSACVNYEGNIYLPFSYRNTIEVFRNMNSLGKQSMDLFRSFIEDVRRRKDLSLLPKKLLNLLTIILKVMIGMYNEAFNPLSYALRNEKCLNNNEARHCLTFVLILFSNMGLIPQCPDSQLQSYRKKIYDSVKQCSITALRDVYTKFSTSTTVVGTFGAAKELAEASKDELACVNLLFNQKLNNIEIAFGQAQLVKIYQRRLLPIAVDSTSQPHNPVVMRAPTTTLSAEAKEFHPAVAVTSRETTDNTIASDPEPELSTQDSIEADPEAIAALKTTQTLDSNPTSDPALPEHKDPMVDEDFCRLCACSLTPDTSKQESETYSQHCHTEEHITNSEIYKRFNDEDTDYYKPRKEALLALLSEGAALYKGLKNKELQAMIEKIGKELKDSDAELQNIRYSAKWREGVTLVQTELSGKLDMLHMKLGRKIEVCQKEKLDLENARKQEAQKGEEDSRDIDESDEEEEIEQANYGEKIRKNKRTKAKRKRGKKK